jgi:UDP-N-acetylmuramate: L-alanyl-gamma-D-glutamyl-meso-diaminopimelate ligase
MHIHIIAVAGTGMGALAGLLKELGHQVSGSDVTFDPPIGPALRAWGIQCFEGFDARHLEPPPDLVVVGNVCRRDNVEAVAAFERGLEVTHIAGALQRFALADTSPLVVAGTHGKTTTSALCAWLLDATEQMPGFLIGGIPTNFGRSFQVPGAAIAGVATPASGRRRPFVIEGDEYDTAYFEKTAKFLHYRPEIAIITSIEHDHIDIYPTPEAYLDAFLRFIATVPAQGLIVANAADPVVVRLVRDAAHAPVVWYALSDELEADLAPTWVAAPADSTPTASHFDLFAGGVACGRYSLVPPGRHNVKNALASLAAVAQGYGVALQQLRAPLAAFSGVQRRQELLGTPRAVYVYDDFAHHPTAVRETLLALRARHPDATLYAVFEPRSATACRNLHQQQYVAAFDQADEVLLAPLGRPGLAETERLDLSRLVRDLRRAGRAARAHDDIDSIVEYLTQRAEPGDAIALLSNGAFGGIHSKLLDALA